jgi:hypothetical protein
MSDKTVNNFESLRCSCPNLVQREPIQSLERRFDLILSSELLHKIFCVAFSQVRTNENRLTKSTLLDLLRRKSEGREQFYYYLHQNVGQSWRRRDPGVNTESAEEVFKRRKQIHECVVARIDVFDRLRNLDVREI